MSGWFTREVLVGSGVQWIICLTVQLILQTSQRDKREGKKKLASDFDERIYTIPDRPSCYERRIKLYDITQIQHRHYAFDHH